MKASARSARTSAPRRHPTLAWIAAFKLVKVAALLVVAAEAMRLRRPGELDDLVSRLADLPLAASGWRPMLHLIHWLSEMNAHSMTLIVLITCAYAALYTVEGIGLWLQKRWAEYLTTIATSSLIPFELWELTRGPTPLKIAALVINIAIVVYLIHVLRADRAQH
jgi:uncharacterized membrane protein (DUF2068 family)